MEFRGHFDEGFSFVQSSAVMEWNSYPLRLTHGNIDNRYRWWWNVAGSRCRSWFCSCWSREAGGILSILHHQQLVSLLALRLTHGNIDNRYRWWWNVAGSRCRSWFCSCWSREAGGILSILHHQQLVSLLANPVKATTPCALQIAMHWCATEYQIVVICTPQ